MSKLSDWIEPSRRQSQHYNQIADMPGARQVVAAATRTVSGRTPDIALMCGSHPSGYAIALRLTRETIEIDVRHTDAADPAKIALMHLARWPHSGSLEWTCAHCGTKWDRVITQVLYLGIQAIVPLSGSNKTRFAIRFPMT